MRDHLIELTLVCLDCNHVTEAPFRYDSDCGELISLHTSGENCEECGSVNLEEVE